MKTVPVAVGANTVSIAPGGVHAVVWQNSASGAASAFNMVPLVVMAISRPGISWSISTSVGSFARSVGSPPVTSAHSTHEGGMMRQRRSRGTPLVAS